jgi:hypothetical protein
MANNNNLFKFTPEFITQVIFGSSLAFIFFTVGAPPSVSVFLGILGGSALGWFTNASKTSPEPPTLASTDGVDAGLKYWLFLLLGFAWLGYPAPMSILLGGIGAIGGGWIIAWWRSSEEAQTKLPIEIAEDTEVRPTFRLTKEYKRRPVRRFRRAKGINWRFWER